MSFSIRGYVLEPPRVGQANSPFTSTPNTFVSDPTAFNAAFPSNESQPRCEYLVLALSEGSGLLVDARFGWTKNEVVQRFDYSSRDGCFKPLPGSSPSVVGVLSPTSNIDRLVVTPPIQALPTAPYRLSLGTGVGTPQAVLLVPNDAAFGDPPQGTTELSLETGNLNWSPDDLADFNGIAVQWQQQSFFAFDKSDGKIGLANDPVLMLNPIPGPGQFPLLRFGYGFHLAVSEVPSFFVPPPPPGAVQWERATGRLRFNSIDVINHVGMPVYYDGVLFAQDLQLPRQSIGTVGVLSPIVGLPPAGGDLIFFLPNASPYYQFPQFVLTSSFDATGKAGVVQVNPSTGAVQLSVSDSQRYAGQEIRVAFGDLLIERGISLRMFRTPVNLDAQTSGAKDVTSLYNVASATWADPIIGAPQVFLPAIPVDDALYSDADWHILTGCTSPEGRLRVEVLQKQGSFTGVLPRLDRPSAPAGVGYYIDFDARSLYYAKRNERVLVPLLRPSGAVQLPDPLVLSSNLLLELETAGGSGVFHPLTLGTDCLFDGTSGVVTFTTSQGLPVREGLGGSFSDTILEDPSADFVAAGVQAGDTLLVSNSDAAGVYTVSSVLSATSLATDVPAPPSPTAWAVAYSIQRGREVLADRYFQEVVLTDPSTMVERLNLIGVCRNAPRLQIPISSIGSMRFRFGSATASHFSTEVDIVSTDANFAPALPPDVVQVSQATGNLNFSAANFGANVYSVRKLVPKTDYQLSAGLGLIQFTTRLLSLEEVLVTYVQAPPTTDPPTAPGPAIQEYATFLVRKEVTQDHPAPTSVLSFNPLGRPVAANPSPAVFRGGRPQQLGTQCVVDTGHSTITFLPDSQLTNALPHGAIVDSSERVYIDYYVLAAVGGEKTTSVLHGPILTAAVGIQSGTSSFVVHGDQRMRFPTGYLLRIEQQEVYLLTAPIYDGSKNQTTVNLAGGQIFQEDYSDPKLYVSSGVTRASSTPSYPAYFVPELQSFEPVARGMNKVVLNGDRTSSYRRGTIALFTDGGTTVSFLQVTGSKYSSGKTEVTLTSNTPRQYVYGQQEMFYSVRPILEESTTEAQTSLGPILSQPYVVYRRVEGEVGTVLSSPSDYQIDDTGHITFARALQPAEEFTILYMGTRIVDAGVRLRATYTCQIVPNETNGLLGQILQASHLLFSPDNFYYRVETLTNFKGEIAQELQQDATSSSPSSGPITSNSSQPALFEQGRESVYFAEGHLANKDLVARANLKFFNDEVNYLEDILHAVDGRVVGDQSGRFRFDGNIDNPVVTSPSAATNQIDDLLVVSPFPTPDGTAQAMYLPGSYSRFYPTRRNLFGGPTLDVTQDGAPIASLKFKNLSSVPGIAFRRIPRAQIAWDYPAGTSSFVVDNAHGSSDLQCPPFAANMRVVIRDAAGNEYLSDAAHVTVDSIDSSPESISLSAPVSVPVPAGATIFLAPSDASSEMSGGAQHGYAMVYQFGKDINVKLDTGELLYASRKFPFDGSLPGYPTINPVPEGDLLQVNGAGLFNSLTAPYKAPAFVGGTLDDDGDQAVPLLRTTDGETLNENGGGALNTELSSEETIRVITTSSYVGTGTVADFARVVITDLSAFTTPVPKRNDLVRILSGLNGQTAFRRITSVNIPANQVTVDTPFDFQDSGFTYTVAVSSSIASGTATLDGTKLTDLAAHFMSGEILVGYTVVMQAGANDGYRRQIAAIVSDTELTLDAAFPSPLVGGSYRIDNSLGTYGGTGSHLPKVSDALATEVAAVSREQAALTNFFSLAFNQLFSSTHGTVIAPNLNRFVDGTADFITLGVTPANFVYVGTGAEAGIYPIVSVDSPTQLTVASPFPVAGTGISYQIVSQFGTSAATLVDLFGIVLANQPFLASTQVFQAFVDTPVAVMVAGASDPDAFARGLLTSALDARITSAQSRATYLSDPAAGLVVKVEQPLASSDRLYDKRYAWIDARINLEKGYLAQKTRAKESRIKAQQDVYNQLVKLLSVQGG